MLYQISKLFWLIAAPTSALVLIAAIATFWAVLRKSKRAAWLALTAACGLLIGAFTPLGIWLTLPLEERFPPSDLHSAPDGIIVLGGDTGYRIIALTELARRFPKARLVYSGPGETSDSGENLLKLFVRLGGDAARLTMENQSRTTYENATYTAALIKPQPHERWLLVTSAMHMPRATGCFRHVGMFVEPYPVESRTGGGPRPVFEFGTAAKTLSQVDMAAKEWIGLVAYRLMGKTDALFPRP